MSVKNLRILAIALCTVATVACQKEPSTSDLQKDFLVYTAHDANTDFAAVETYFIPDSILVIGNNDKAEYWKNDSALELIGTVVGRMEYAGFQRVMQKELADVGLQLSFVRKVTYFVGADYPYWWWYYPYYWAPGYWGDWAGWHYPYRVYYGYTAGSLLMEMVELEDEETGNKKLPVVWDSYIAGLLTSSEELNLQRAITAVEQAFAQSPYLNKNAR